MNEIKMEDAIGVVRRLNNELTHEEIKFDFIYDGFNYYIKFLGVYLWDADNDNRDYYENDTEHPDEKIPLEEFIKNEAIRLTKQIVCDFGKKINKDDYMFLTNVEYALYKTPDGSFAPDIVQRLVDILRGLIDE